MKYLTCLVLTFFTLVMLDQPTALGETLSPTSIQNASTSELPKALESLGPESAEILSREQAHDVRGSWILGFSLPLINVGIEGRGLFNLDLTTHAGGVYQDEPVQIRIQLGR